MMRTILYKVIRVCLPASWYQRIKIWVKGQAGGNLARAYLLARSVKRKNTEGRIAFRSLDDLVLACRKLMEMAPNDYDLIVGVPRSGLFPATYLALAFGRPLQAAGAPTDTEAWISKASGRNGATPRRILVIDDSATTGEAVIGAKNRIQECYPESVVHTAVIYAVPQVCDKVDYYVESVPHPRIFEWNLMHAKQGLLASDMDGVLCENCPPGASDDEETYLAWAKSAKAHLIPGFKIDFIVTNRLERHRAITEAWLKDHGVEYGELLMSPLTTKPSNSMYQIDHKVERICGIKPDLFWESSQWEAENIWRKTRVPTLCVDEMIFYS